MSLQPSSKTGSYATSAICARFRHASPADVQHLAGAPAALISYLARTHDLTASEAAELLTDCRVLRSEPTVKAA